MRPLVIVFLSGFLFLVMHVSGQAPKQPPAKKEDPPYKRVLTGADAKRVAELEEKLKDSKTAGKFVEAQVPAQQIRAIRTRVQGAKHWETADAGREVQTLKRLAALSAPNRADYLGAMQLEEQATQFFIKGRYPQTERLLRKVLAVQSRLLGEDHGDTVQFRH